MANSEFHKELTEANLCDLESIFGVKHVRSGSTYSFGIASTRLKNTIALDIIMEDGDNLISVYSENSHLQLQSCKAFIISQMLEEVIFYSDCGEKISGLIISKQGDCSLYANVDKKTLKTDFMNLNSEKLLSAVALSVIESL
ncbi:MAG TPA: hypothetical protein VN514_06195 [Ignavibacteria bacterium]|nr:hypothetical protein [Ignavibacteria bacterium]